ncbi:MAG: NUDIX hydrolase [Bacteroidota bacterium]
MLKKWKQKSTSTRLKNNWWSYKIDLYEIPKRHNGEYHYVFTNGSSMVVPILKNGKIILVEQFRYLNQKNSLEFPCGGVKEKSNNLKTAIDELKEETGYTSKSIDLIAEFNPFNGVTSEVCKIFLASDLKKGKSKPDKTEEFIIHEFYPKEIDDLISEGKIWDGMTLATWTLAKKYIL